MADEMDIQIRCSSGKAFGWRGSKASSVAEFKDQIAGDAAVPAAEQRLIYKGRALQDAQLLAELDIEDGGTVHLLRAVARAPAPPAPAAPTLANPAGGGGLDLFGGGMGPGMSQADMQRRLMADPEAMSRVLNSPLTRSLMENPALMQSIVQSNPQLQRAMEQNPQLRHALTDPNLLREAVEVARSPARLREAMRHQDLALSQLENHPEGFNALRRMYNEVQEPLFDSLDNMGGTGGGGGGGAAPAVPEDPNAPPGALPNPWARPAAPAAPAMPAFDPAMFAAMAGRGPPGAGRPPAFDPALLAAMPGAGGPPPPGLDLLSLLRPPTAAAAPPRANPARPPPPANPWAHIPDPPGDDDDDIYG